MTAKELDTLLGGIITGGAWMVIAFVVYWVWCFIKEILKAIFKPKE